MSTLDATNEEEATTPYRLETHGRYSHAQDYVERVMADVGLRSVVTHAELRMESGAPVQGLALRPTKVG